MLKFFLNQAFTGLVFFLFPLTNAWAASFAVSPVIAHLTEEKTISSFTIKNQSPVATAIELQLFRWEKISGEEKLTPAPELLVTPTIFKVSGNASQVIRVGLRQPITTSQEKAYRLILKEIPSPPKPGFHGLNVLLRISIPIFVSKTIAYPELRWHASLGNNGKLLLNINNTGLGHTKLLKLRIKGDSQSAPLDIERESYLLAGDQLQWPIELDVKPGMELQLVADTSKGQIKTKLKVE